MIKPSMSYHDFLGLIYNQENNGRSVKDFTFQVTEDCNLCCTYCYQINKTPNRMTFDIAKQYIDYLFENKDNPDFFYSKKTTQGFIINFIGGEPFLEIDLVDQIIEYFEKKLIETNEEEWMLNHAYNFSTNGTLYFTPKVQKFLQKYNGIVNVGVTIDGNKELHDSCRLFPDGSGSYDIAVRAALNEKARGNEGTKITISPNNIDYIFDGITNLLKLGFKQINANCVFEDVWTVESAKRLFNELKRISDWICENKLYNKIYLSILYPDNFTPLEEHQLDRGWCGTSSGMSSLDYKGDLYPCIRFMKSSLGENLKPLAIGDINNGFLSKPEHIENYDNIKKSYIIKNANPSKCLECSIANGCGWCAGCEYQLSEGFAQRKTTTCDTHKMQALASKYLCKICNDKESFDNIKLEYNMYNHLIDENDFNKINIWKEEE